MQQGVGTSSRPAFIFTTKAQRTQSENFFFSVFSGQRGKIMWLCFRPPGARSTKLRLSVKQPEGRCF
jgi:hypothetical protein